MALMDRPVAVELDLPAEHRVVKSIGERTPPCCSQLSVMGEHQNPRGYDKAGVRDCLLRASIDGEVGKSGEELEASFMEGNISRGVGPTAMKESRLMEHTGGAIAEAREAADPRETQVNDVRESGSQGRETAQACISGCSHLLSSPTRLAQFSENNSVAHSDAESDSGFESATHTCVSEALDNGPTAVGTSEDSESDDDERIKQAILHLDVKVDRKELSMEALEKLRLLPSGYQPLPHQVAGHMHVDGRMGFLRKANQRDVLYKPVHAGTKGLREMMFYKGLFSSPEEELPRDLKRLKKLIPEYHGICDITDRAGETSQFLKLEDVTSRFHKPCILDIKVRKRHEPTDKQKIESEKTKYPLQEVLGFRISGMRVYQSASKEYLYFDKEIGRSCSINKVLESLRVFFLDGSHKRSDAIAAVSDRLYDFLDWIQTQASYKLFATSLLIVYEGDSNQPIKSPDQLIDVRWVDFAYACELKCTDLSQPPHVTLDENVIFGLKNLIQFLERIKNEYV